MMHAGSHFPLIARPKPRHAAHCGACPENSCNTVKHADSGKTAYAEIVIRYA
jgi:hypothetical protein